MTGFPLRSMTGFGRVDRELEVGRLRVEIRTVNHRYLNVQLRMPPGFERHQVALERAVKAHFARGHANVSVLLDRSPGAGETPPIVVDLERARGYVAALRSLRDELELDGSVDVGLLPWFRDLFQTPQREDGPPEIPEELLVGAVEEAASQVVEMREEEGARLAGDLAARLEVMEREVEAVERRAPERLRLERDRLRSAIRELLADETTVDEERIAREVAHMAERWDIHEEIVRFRSHLEMFRDTLRKGDPGGIGKRFGFIAQEILREANTMGAKANDAEIAQRVVTLKEAIERLREQLENVE